MLLLPAREAAAEKRVALVIGNSAYQNVAKLVNPANDSVAMAAALKKANFDIVDERNDLTTTAMRRALREFVDKSRDADVAVVYYAGHGIELDGNNYLIPVDAQLERDTDVYDEAFALDRVLLAVEPAKQLRLVILDACRDNPFSKTMKRTIATRSIGRGLAKIEPSSPNTMIAFAAKAGSTASDGDGRNSPFAAALVNHITKPGLDLRKAFGFVRDDVLKVTNNKQEPFVYGSLGGNDVSLVPAVLQPVAPAASAPAPAAPDTNAAARRDYELALQVGTREAWDFFIASYPEGFYSKLALAQRNKLAAEEARLAATEKARVAAEEQAKLAAEGARAAEQAKAAAQAKAAEEARIAAEKKKAAEDAKVAEADRVKTAAVAKAAEDARIAAEKKAADDAKKLAADEAKKLAADKVAADKLAADKAKDDKPIGPVAALTPPADAPAQPDNKTALADIPRSLQSELRRVGCNTGAIDGNWNAAAQRSLDLFNKNAGMKLDVKVASLDALDAVKSKPGRICPLICEHGYKAEGDKCSKITCRAGYEVGDDNTCEKIEAKKPPPKRDEAAPAAKPDAPKPAAKSADGAGQMVCSHSTGICRQVKKGCRVESVRGQINLMQNVEVCN